MNNQRNLLAYFALAAVCIIWGTTYLVLRVGVMQFPPFLFSSIRFLIAGPILLAVTYLAGQWTTPSGKVVFQQAISGLFMAALGVGVVGWAEMYVSSGLAAIICSVMPVWVILINLIIGNDERPTLPIIIGLAVGLAGIMIIFSEHLGEFGDVKYRWGIFLTFFANINWAIGSVWTKRNSGDSNPFINASIQMFFGGVFLIPLSLLFDDYLKIQWTPGVWVALIYLILVGSVAAYACYSYAIKKLPMTLVSLYAYINPLVAVVLGWLILSEKLNLRISLGILITIAGIYIVNRGHLFTLYWKARLKF